MKFNSLQRGRRNTDCLRKPRARFGGLRFGAGNFELRFCQCHLRGGEFRPRRCARIDAALHQRNNFALRGELLLQQRQAMLRHGKFHERRANAAANLPSSGNEIPARGLGNFFSLGDAFAALAHRLHREVKIHRRSPRRRHKRRGIVSRRDAQRGIGAATGGLYACLGELPLRAGDGEVWMKIKRGECERIQIPFHAAGIFREKFFQPRVIEPARLQLRRGIFRRERTRLVVRAAGEHGGSQDERPKFHAVGSCTVTMVGCVGSETI